jgi:hypothetical protein
VNLSLNSLYRFIRYETIRKDDPNVLTSKDLDLATEYVLDMDFDDGFSIVEVDGNKEIQPAPDVKQKKRLILKVALSLLIPEDAFSYRTASLSKFIEGIPGLEEHRENLRERLNELESGDFGRPVLSNSDIEKHVNESERLSEALTEAQSNV